MAEVAESDDRMGGRELEDDHDLLTYNEAGARLREEIALAQAQLAAIGEDDPGRSALQRRLDLLGESAQRNSALAEHDKGARGFLEYRPQG